jgi:hypothetical protein
MVTNSSAGTPVIETANCALLCPARTVTEPGVVTFALPSLSETTAFTAAAAVKEAVQVEVPAALKLFGEQESEVSTLGAGAASPICVERVTPLKLAVTVAVWAEAIVPAVTENAAELEPEGTVTLAGVVSVALSSLKPIVTPETAAFVSVTVQVAL